MGKFLKWDDSNWRTYDIDTTAGSIKRPKKVITKADLMAAIFVVDGEECIGVSAKEDTTTITATAIVNGAIATIVYTFATDTFKLGNDALTNKFIDEYGREEMFI